MRFQFFPNKALEDKLINEATEQNIDIAELIENILNKYYGIDSLSYYELESQIFAEIKEYISTLKENEKFDLNQASTTYREIPMSIQTRPNIIRARIGKAFSKAIRKGHFPEISAYTTNGKVQRNPNTRAAIYIYTKYK